VIQIDCKNKKIENCLKEYRQKVEMTGQTRALRNRKTFEKPSVVKRRQILLAKYINEKYGNS